jgi:hypothetical protein
MRFLAAMRTKLTLITVATVKTVDHTRALFKNEKLPVYAAKILAAVIEHSVHLHIAFALHIIGGSIGYRKNIYGIGRGITGKILVYRAGAGISVCLIFFAAGKCDHSSYGHYRKRKYLLHNIFLKAFLYAPQIHKPIRTCRKQTHIAYFPGQGYIY